MPEGHTSRRRSIASCGARNVDITNRFMATRLLTAPDGRIAGAIGVNTRTAEFLVVRAKAVILCVRRGRAARACRRPAICSAPTKTPPIAGDGYAMAYHAGAALANLECFQINPLIKDYNGPACAYVAGPLGGYTANSEGDRFIECDYWAGQMMLEFYRELQSGKGPVFLKLDHLRGRNDRPDRDDPAHQRAPDPRPVP